MTYDAEPVTRDAAAPPVDPVVGTPVVKVQPPPFIKGPHKKLFR